MGNLVKTVNVREKKRVLAEFVKDMAELESEELKARKTAEKCFKEAEEIRKKKEKVLVNLETDVTDKKNFIRDLKTERPSFIQVLFGNIFTGLFVAAIVCLITYAVFNSTIAVLVLGLIAFFIVFLIGMWKNISLRVQDNEKLGKYPNIIRQEEQKIIELKDEIKRRTTVLKKHGEDCLQYANHLAEEKESLYALNVIPPNYRYIDCIMVLDYVFRNDLADDMRGAVLYYEDRIFRGSVIKGLDNIVNAIDNLSSEMYEVQTKLQAIEKQSKKIFDGIKEGNTLQAEMLAENYAAHQKMEYYAEQHRRGLF